jgi:hypothetical protein
VSAGTFDDFVGPAGSPLLVEALKSGNSYTSGRLVSRGRLDMPYGRISARIKMQSGQDIWPAFWMLGSDYANVGWPECGEIDLIELGDTGTTHYATLHGPQGKSTGWIGSPTAESDVCRRKENSEIGRRQRAGQSRVATFFSSDRLCIAPPADRAGDHTGEA